MPITTKTVKGQKYVYFAYYDGELKKKIETYCGPESEPESLVKARKLEKEYLRKQIKDFKLRIEELEIQDRKQSD